MIRAGRGRGNAVKILHGNDRGFGTGKSFSAEIGSGAGFIVCA
jgi:hypothetical protein